MMNNKLTSDNIYLEFAKKLAYQAGEIMLEYFQVGLISETKPDGSPITLADKKINSLVIDEVAKAFPAHSVRGEEESNQKLGDEFVWVCDPIDGTIPYAMGIPTNVFSLALVKVGVPILGVVNDPYTKRLYHASKGNGAFLNGTPIHVNDHSLQKYESFGITSSMKLIDTVGLTTDLRRRFKMQLFAYKSDIYTEMQIANGQFVFYISGATEPHDVAATKIIVEEAGGKVTNSFGQEQRYDQPINGAIVSNGLVHDELVALIKPFLATN